MAHTQIPVRRADADIEADIESLLRQPPLTHDRSALHITVSEGRVRLSGHVSTPNIWRFLLKQLENIPGIVDVDDTDLADDETIRIEAGQVLPEGVRVARCRHGTVVLTGSLPDGVSADEAAARVMAVPGVRRVLTTF